MTTSSPFRLSPDVSPEHYRLVLEPDLEQFTFAGSVSIDLTVRRAVSEIVLNAAELAASSARVEASGGLGLSADRIELDEESERLTLGFPGEIPAGQATLTVEFDGFLNDQLRGFYRSSYTAADGAERRLATTQFEATDARRAFPCWDEPSVKATFDVTLVVPSELEAISNMPIAGVEQAPSGKKAVRFETTPRMSTYLLAFIVGDMACVEAAAPDGTLVRVWATRGKEHLGRFALESSVNALAYMNDYFGIAYPLPQDGPHRRARLRGGRHGELGRHHLPRDRPAVRPRGLRRGGQAAHPRSRRSRNGAHVVR